jgi:hypothetical protein
MHIAPSSKQVLNSDQILVLGYNILLLSDVKGIKPYREANSDGFNTAVHPAAKEGATFQVAINRG